MRKHKLSRIIDEYACDNGLIIFLCLSISFIPLSIVGVFYDLHFLILLVPISLIDIIFVIKVLIIRKRLLKNEEVSIVLKSYNVFIKETIVASISITISKKIFIIDENKNKYNYYYLNGPAKIFKEYKDKIENGEEVKLIVFKNTKIIKKIFVDGKELEDLYSEPKYARRLRKPIIYKHLFYKRTKKAVYEYVEYNINDVKLVFENSQFEDELYIINFNNRYVRISFDLETHSNFYIEKEMYNSFDEMQMKLEINGFIFDDVLRVIYTCEDTDPSSFDSFIDEVK